MYGKNRIPLYEGDGFIHPGPNQECPEDRVRPEEKSTPDPGKGAPDKRPSLPSQLAGFE
ncbi:MAG TPA: hypothetical protein VFI80_06975 [Burkholderiales bacterium]|nr:hypothetical protein [Burkholderiales bacterium]